ncbi:hypothetical protein [Sphingobium sp. B11D3D]|uniref:hypothetical protein n=1 Tax=Sphingobium sp. B11D3D TaxID=2940576 RepID=UPI0022249F8D|nr:hypothetical protein [Sphingobium sp. B11D3D]
MPLARRIANFILTCRTVTHLHTQPDIFSINRFVFGLQWRSSCDRTIERVETPSDIVLQVLHPPSDLCGGVALVAVADSLRDKRVSMAA